MKTTFLFCSILIGHISCFMDQEIVKSYFDKKLVKYGVVFGCFSKIEQVGLTRYLSSNRIIQIVNINKAHYPLLLENRHHLGVALDLECKQSKDLIFKSGELGYFDIKHHWLVLSSQENVTEYFQHAKFVVTADINVVTPLSKEATKFKITDFYSPGSRETKRFVYDPLGYYNKTTGYKTNSVGSKYWKRRDLTGVHVRSTAVLFDPYEGDPAEYIKTYENRNYNTFSRYQSKLYLACAQRLNYTLDVAVVNSWGYPLGNGSWDGLCGALQRNDTDIGLSPVVVRPDRMEVLRYGSQTWVLKVVFLFRNPKTKSSIEVFLKPLSSSIWFFTLLAAVICIVLLRISLYEEKITLRDRNLDYTWSYLIISIVGALTQQGFESTPRLLSGRIITIFVFLLFLLVYQFYSASLVSYLLLKDTDTIKTVADILNSDLEVGIEDIVYNRDYFKLTKDEVSIKLFKKKIYRPNNKTHYLPVPVGVKLVKGGSYAFHVDLDSASPIIEQTFELKEICELRKVQLFTTVTLHTPMVRKYPYRDILETCLQKFSETGIKYRELSYWCARKLSCIESANTKTFKVGLDDLYPAFMSLAIGIALSLIMLVMEIKIHNKLNNKQDQENYAVQKFVN